MAELEGRDSLLDIVPETFAKRGVDITSEDGAEALRMGLHGAVEHSAELLARQLRKSARRMLREHRTLQRAFEKRLAQRWGRGFDTLEMVIVASHEAGEEFNKSHRALAVQENDLVFEVLVRLHARACQVAREVLHLMQGGYAAGAHARWRTLHEIAVVAHFVRQAGNETAERYLLHEGIDSFRAARQYLEFQDRLRVEPITSDELEVLNQRHEALCAKFGKDFKNDWGWAAHALGKQNPTFRDIEAAVELEHLRPYYKMASYAVHAGPKGVLFNLGLLGDSDVLLTGASNAGLADPGHASGISLVQVTTALLTHKPNTQRLIECCSLAILTDELGEQLLQAHQELVDDSAKYDSHDSETQNGA